MSEGERHETIGPYRILEVLGEGGMGVVYLGEQREPIRRQVALKVIKLGMDTKDVLARFAAESQALALMDHPSIARVIEAGTTAAGRPYFAMEYVQGIPIAAFCDRQQLDLRARLELFVQVADAIQHAHHKGVIHRDIKSSNVLVCMREGGVFAKVIDFGVAKATNQRLTEQTLFTARGMIVGTPEYMSPEQAEASHQGVDTRTDVYSLGVLLYELLAGVLPFDASELRNAGYLEIQRRIREDEPPRPSTRFAALGAEAGRMAANRQTDSGTWVRMLRGDLDWVVMRAMAKSPQRRYQSASEFAADVRRYLKGEAVDAGAPSAAYRLSRFLRRYRKTVVVATLLFASLAAGLAVSLSQYYRAETNAIAALEEAGKAKRAASDLTEQKREVQEQLRRTEAQRVLLEARNLIDQDPPLALQLALCASGGCDSAEVNSVVAVILERMHTVAAWQSPARPIWGRILDDDTVAVIGADAHLRVHARGSAAPVRDVTLLDPEPSRVEMAKLGTALAAVGIEPWLASPGCPLLALPACMPMPDGSLVIADRTSLASLRLADGRWERISLPGAPTACCMDRMTGRLVIWSADGVFYRWSPGAGGVVPIGAVPDWKELSQVERDIAPCGFIAVVGGGSAVVHSARAASWLISMQDGSAQQILRQPMGWCHVLPDGRFVLMDRAGSQVFDGVSGALLHKLPAMACLPSDLAANCLGGLANKGFVRAWDAQDGRQLFESRLPVRSLAVDPDGSHLMLVTEDGICRRYSMADWQERAQLAGLGAGAHLLACKGDRFVLLRGDRLELCTLDSALMRMSAPSALSAVMPEDLQGLAAAFGAKLTFNAILSCLPLLSTTVDREVRIPADLAGGTGPQPIWQRAVGERLAQLQCGQTQGIWKLFSPDGRWCYSPKVGEQWPTAAVFSVASGSPVSAGVMVGGHQATWNCTALASACWTRQSHLLQVDATDALVRLEPSGGSQGVKGLFDTEAATRFDAAGATDLIALRNAGEIAVVDGKGSVRCRWRPSFPPVAHLCVPHRDAVVCLGPNAEMAAFSPAGELLWSRPPLQVQAWAAAENGGFIAVGTPAGALTVIETQRGSTVWSREGQGKGTGCVAFTKDGSLVACCGLDNTVRIRAVSDGRMLSSLTLPVGKPFSCGFSADGATLVVAASTGRIWFLPVDLGAAGRSMAPHPLTDAERLRFGVK